MITYHTIFLIIALLHPDGVVDVSVVPVNNVQVCGKWAGIITNDFDLQDKAITYQQYEDDYEGQEADKRTKLIRVGCKHVEVTEFVIM